MQANGACYLCGREGKLVMLLISFQSELSISGVHNTNSNSILKDHRYPSIPNESHHPTTNGNNTEEEAVAVQICA